MRFRLVLEYDGADFAGWQLQPGVRTVQGVLEEGLEVLFREPVRAHPSGRTDAGVHALRQVAHFDAALARTPEEVLKALNGLLPPDVAVVEAAEVPPEFDARRWAHAKTYRYTWLDRPARSPLRRRHVWHVRGPLDVRAMNSAARSLVGRHDFSSFRASGCTAEHPVRHLAAATVRRHGDEVHLEVRGTGFLRHMVRILAGTLLEVGVGKRPASWVVGVLRAQDRTAAGRTAPAYGLTLVDIEYGEQAPEWHGGRQP